MGGGAAVFSYQKEKLILSRKRTLRLTDQSQETELGMYILFTLHTAKPNILDYLKKTTRDDPISGFV